MGLQLNLDEDVSTATDKHIVRGLLKYLGQSEPDSDEVKFSSLNTRDGENCFATHVAQAAFVYLTHELHVVQCRHTGYQALYKSVKQQYDTSITERACRAFTRRRGQTQ